MKNSKKVSLLVVLMIIMTSLSACTTDTKLMTAFLKQEEIESFKSKTDYSFNLSSEGLSEENQFMLEMVEDAVNNFTLTLDQITKVENKGEKVEGKLYFTGKLGDDLKKATIWVDADFKDPINIVEVFKLPNELLELMGEDFKAKDYIVYDLNKLVEIGNNSRLNKEALEEISNWSEKVREVSKKASVRWIKDFNPKLNIVERVGKKEIDGEILDLYRIKISDKDAKSLFKYTLNYLLEDEDLNILMEEYLEIIKKYSMVEEGSKEIEVIKTQLNPENKEELKKKINESLSKIDDISILDKEGIVIDLGINNKGYISYEKTNINLMLDLEQLSKIDDGESKGEGKLNFKVNYETKINRINDKTLDINMPKTTKENSIDLVDYISEQMKDLDQKIKEMDTQDNN